LFLGEHNNALKSADHMDSDRAIDMYVPFNTWGPKGQMSLRLHRFLFLLRRAVVEFIRSL
jgi:hypothetical protein